MYIVLNYKQHSPFANFCKKLILFNYCNKLQDLFSLMFLIYCIIAAKYLFTPYAHFVYDVNKMDLLCFNLSCQLTIYIY